MRVFNRLLIPSCIAILIGCGGAKIEKEPPPTSADISSSFPGLKPFKLNSTEASELWEKLKTIYDASSAPPTDENIFNKYRIAPEFTVRFNYATGTSVEVESGVTVMNWNGTFRITSDEDRRIINEHVRTLATSY